MKKKQNTEPPKAQPIQFQQVTLQVYQPGRGYVYCALDDPRATVFGINGKGEKCGAQRPVSNVFSVEVRSTNKMTGAGRALLHEETWEQPLEEAPKIPANALFIAKAFELAGTK